MWGKQLVTFILWHPCSPRVSSLRAEDKYSSRVSAREMESPECLHFHLLCFQLCLLIHSLLFKDFFSRLLLKGVSLSFSKFISPSRTTFYLLITKIPWEIPLNFLPTWIHSTVWCRTKLANWSMLQKKPISVLTSCSSTKCFLSMSSMRLEVPGIQFNLSWDMVAT